MPSNLMLDKKQTLFNLENALKKVFELPVVTGGNALQNKVYYQKLLHLSAEKGYFNSLALLLHKGVDIDAKNGSGQTALHIAIAKGNINMVDYLLSKKADITIKEAENWSVLHLAAYYGYASIVKLLLQQNIDIEACEYEGWTPLHMAVSCGHTEVVKLLVEKGADVYAKDDRSISPLDLASSKSRKDIKDILTSKINAQLSLFASTIQKRSYDQGPSVTEASGLFDTSLTVYPDDESNKRLKKD